jgi:hypothetical protein
LCSVPFITSYQNVSEKEKVASIELIPQIIDELVVDIDTSIACMTFDAEVFFSDN